MIFEAASALVWIFHPIQLIAAHGALLAFFPRRSFIVSGSSGVPLIDVGQSVSPSPPLYWAGRDEASADLLEA